MNLRLATLFVLSATTALAFQNCAPSMPEEDGIAESSSLDDESSGYDNSVFTGGGSSTIPTNGSSIPVDNSGSNSGGGGLPTPPTSPIPTPSTGGGSTLPVPGEGRIAIYRVYNSQNGDHLFTNNNQEASALDQTPEWQIEGIAFVLFSNNGNGRMPVYRCYNPVVGQHYVSHDSNCEAQGMTPEGLLGYASTVLADTSSAPLYRCIAIQPPLRFLATNNGAECAPALMRVDYQYGFVMPPSMAP